MNKKIDIIVANSSGNITLMVLTPTERKDYKRIATQLLQNKKLGGEQVAFLLPELEQGYPKMEMCGLEFCGNASRAFALYTSSIDPNPTELVVVKVSGYNKPLTARITPYEPNPVESEQSGSHKTMAMVAMEMPVPNGMHYLSSAELSARKGGSLVEIDGISHLIVEDMAPARQVFETIKNRVYETIDPTLPAFGIMFYDTINKLMIPVVYVKDVDTIYFEGSCASGTVAASYALAKEMPDGIHQFTMQQPAGILYTTVEKDKGRIERIFLKGLVTLSDVMQITLSDE